MLEYIKRRLEVNSLNKMYYYFLVQNQFMAEIECKIRYSPHFLGSCMFKYNDTISFCNISHEKNDKLYLTAFSVKWNENHLETDQTKYYENLIEKFLNSIVDLKKFPFRKFNIEFNTGYKNSNRNCLLMCVFNSLCGALIETGLPVDGIFVSTFQNINLKDTLIVFMNEKIIFSHGFSASEDILESNILNVKEEIKEYIEFEIEKVL